MLEMGRNRAAERKRIKNGNASESLAIQNGWFGNNFMIKEFPSTV